MSTPDDQPSQESQPEGKPGLEVRVRRIHRRDLNRTWDFLKKVFRDVNLETVEYQRPRTKTRFLEVYEEEGVEQLLFEVGHEIVGYAEVAFEAVGSDNWVNPRYFEKRDMRPLFVEELATHPDYQGKGVGSFMLDQLQHLARVRGCTHLVLEVAENNENALNWYRKRSFYKLDAAIFMAQKIEAEPELLPPRRLKQRKPEGNPTVPSKGARGAKGEKAEKGEKAARGTKKAEKGHGAKGKGEKKARPTRSRRRPAAEKAAAAKAAAETPAPESPAPSAEAPAASAPQGNGADHAPGSDQTPPAED